MLRDRIGQLERSGKRTPALAHAKTLMTGAANRVLDAPGAEKLYWTDPKDRTIADVVRVEILDALEALAPL